jgi:hypothetical protein
VAIVCFAELYADETHRDAVRSSHVGSQPWVGVPAHPAPRRATARIASNFYGVTLPVEGSYALGIAELIVSLALLVGFYRTISYGLSLLIHTVTVVVSWRQLFDPWGLAKVGNHLWLSTWAT